MNKEKHNEKTLNEYRFKISMFILKIICIIVLLCIIVHYINTTIPLICIVVIFGIIIYVEYKKLKELINFYNIKLNSNEENSENIINNIEEKDENEKHKENEIVKEYSKNLTLDSNTNNNDFKSNYSKENADYYCNRCYNKISFEQYNSFNCLCEECYKEKYGEEEHYCVICNRLISNEEYEMFSGCCEDCYSDINANYQMNGLDEYSKSFLDVIDDKDAYNDLEDNTFEHEDSNYDYEEDDFDEF